MSDRFPLDYSCNFTENRFYNNIVFILLSTEGFFLGHHRNILRMLKDAALPLLNLQNDLDKYFKTQPYCKSAAYEEL